MGNKKKKNPGHRHFCRVWAHIVNNAAVRLQASPVTWQCFVQLERREHTVPGGGWRVWAGYSRTQLQSVASNTAHRYRDRSTRSKWDIVVVTQVIRHAVTYTYLDNRVLTVLCFRLNIVFILFQGRLWWKKQQRFYSLHQKLIKFTHERQWLNITKYIFANILLHIWGLLYATFEREILYF